MRCSEVAELDTKISGGCACGSVNYECNDTPKFSLICQCRQCQRITGTGHSAQFAVDVSKTVISGDLKFHNLTSDAGNIVESAFCGICGNPIYKTTSMAPDLIAFHVATLDNPENFQPQMVVNSVSGQVWDHVDPTLPRSE